MNKKPNYMKHVLCIGLPSMICLSSCEILQVVEETAPYLRGYIPAESRQWFDLAYTTVRATNREIRLAQQRAQTYNKPYGHTAVKVSDTSRAGTRKSKYVIIDNKTKQEVKTVEVKKADAPAQKKNVKFAGYDDVDFI